ncbi:MAG: arcadin 1 [Nitrososphaerota archaeon]|nr:arcadin 1 [Nitrososphaerota archaeon]
MERSPSSPSNSVKVRVYEITSMTDPETGKPGKNIKLVQVKQRGQQQYFGGPFAAGDETGMIRNIMSQFQSMGLVPFGREAGLPKINLFLSESEYDLLGVRFEVNEVYDMILKDGAIRFSKSLEGV